MVYYRVFEDNVDAPDITSRHVHYDRDYIQDNMNSIEELDRIFK